MHAGALIIRFEENTGFLTPDSPLSFEAMGLTNVVEKFRKNAWWELRIIDLDIQSGKLFAAINTYRCSEIEFPEKQIQMKAYFNRIQKITFRDIKTEGLLRTAELKRHASNLTPNFQIKNFEDASERNIQKTEFITSNQFKSKSQIQNIQGSFYVHFKDLHFRLGGISCNRLISGFEEPLEFFISNDYLREEFDAIKNYFTKILDTHKIQVKYELTLQGNTILNLSVQSPEINKINKDTVENVRFEFVNGNIRRKIKSIEDKSVFTMEEVFDHASEGKLPSGIFYNDSDTFLQDLIKVSQTKHFHHLRYLSSLHAHSIMKLRFVLKPLSFIFLVSGERYYYLVWETLDTAEATYIWRSEKNKEALKANFHKVEDILNLIKIQGKIAYIQSGDENMKRIYHDYSEIKNGFVSWKTELESVLR